MKVFRRHDDVVPTKFELAMRIIAALLFFAIVMQVYDWASCN